MGCKLHFCFYFIFLLERRISRETPTLENHGSQTPNSSNFISGKSSPDEINLFMSPVPPGKRQLLNHLRRTLWLFNPGSTGVPGAFLNLSHPVPRFPHRVLIYKVEPSRLAPLSRGRFSDKTRQAASGGPVRGARPGRGGLAPPPPPSPLPRRCEDLLPLLPRRRPSQPPQGWAAALDPLTHAGFLRPSAPAAPLLAPSAGARPRGLYLLLGFRHGAAAEPSCEGQEADGSRGTLGNVVSEDGVFVVCFLGWFCFWRCFMLLLCVILEGERGVAVAQRRERRRCLTTRTKGRLGPVQIAHPSQVFLLPSSAASKTPF